MINSNTIVLHISAKKFSSIAINGSSVNVKKNIDIVYEFKDYQYASTEVILIENEKLILICADIETKTTLANIEFFNSTVKSVSIKTMITSPTVRELSTAKHSIDKYVIVSMYFSGKNKHDEIVRAKITRKIHFVNNLKANMLIENNVFESKKFNIFTFTSIVYIESCEVIISIFIKNRFISQSASVHSIKTRIISSRTKISISIHKISLSERDYFLELAKANFSICFHIVDTTINAILIRNYNSKSIKVSRNFRLSKLIEVEHFNVLHVDSKFSDFVIRVLKSKHKDLFFIKC